MRGIKFEWTTTASGCMVSTSHKPNKDGYLRMRDTRYTGPGRKPLVLHHRATWEKAHGPIQEGYEIDHMCKTRGCFNIEHLQCIPGDVHAVLSSTGRYGDRKEAAKAYWMSSGCTGAALGEKFGVSFSAACKWIRDWKV